MFNERSGWTLSGQFFDIYPSDTYKDALLAGLGNTILCGISACALATFLSFGLIYLTAKTEGGWGLRSTLLIRCIPVPLLLFGIYNILLYLPALSLSFLGISLEVSNRGISLVISQSLSDPVHGTSIVRSWTASSEFLSLLLALALFGGGSILEIIRGAVAGIEVSQAEAGRALGMAERQVFWKVIWPQAVLAAITPITNVYIFILRMTTLGSAVGYIDLYAISNLGISQTGQLVPFLITLAVVMGGTCIILTTASRILERLLSYQTPRGSAL